MKFNLFFNSLRNNNQNRAFLNEKSHQRSCSSHSTHNSNFIIKHDTSQSKRSSKSSKSNSAPSSPNLSKATRSKPADTTKIRSSISTSSNMNRLDETDKRQVKKKLAFSDDETLNDKQGLKNRSSKALSDNEADTTQDTLNVSNGSSSKNKQKRSSSLTKSNQSSNKTSKSANRNQAPGVIYDYKSIYEAFEKPIYEATKSQLDLKSLDSNQAKNKSIVNLVNNKSDSSVSSKNSGASEKMAAINAAALAAAAAIEKEKEKQMFFYKSSNNSSNNSNVSCSLPFSKIVSNFYTINRSQLEVLPVIFHFSIKIDEISIKKI